MKYKTDVTISPIKISSRTNPIIQDIVKLHSTKYRDSQKKFIAQGERTCSTLISAGHKPITIFVTEEHLTAAQKLTTNAHIVLVNQSVMEKISTTQTASGMLALFHIPPQPSYNKLGSGAVLARVADPGNAGTLIRTAAAMNKKTVVCVESVDPWSPKVVQASMGAVGLVNIFLLTWQELIKHKGTTELCALVVKDGKAPDEIDLKNKLIVIGNEAHGIPHEWIADCEETVTLPMPGDFESLNAATAGSIALYLAASIKIREKQ